MVGGGNHHQPDSRMGLRSGSIPTFDELQIGLDRVKKILIIVPIASRKK